jgi:hypothetical protein
MSLIAVERLPEIPERDGYVAGDCFDFLALCQTAAVGELLVLIKEVFDGVADSARKVWCVVRAGW